MTDRPATALLRAQLARPGDLAPTPELTAVLQAVAVEALAIHPGEAIEPVAESDLPAGLREGSMERLAALWRFRRVGPDYDRANRALALSVAVLRDHIAGRRWLDPETTAGVRALAGEEDV